jgi:hypothetical protein
MSEQDQDPEDDSIDRESAVSLPERDAMSVIRGPGTIAPLPPDLTPGTGPTDIAPEPAPNFETGPLPQPPVE